MDGRYCKEKNDFWWVDESMRQVERWNDISDSERHMRFHLIHLEVPLCRSGI